MSEGIAAFALTDPALRPIAEKVLADSGSTRPTASRSTPPRTCSASGCWPTSPTGAATATGSSFPPISTSIRPTSACCGTPACSAPSRGCRRRKGPTPGRWRRCTHEAEQARGTPTREFHIVGGLHPKLRLSYYTDMIRGLKERHPRRPHQGADRGRDRPPGADREDLASARCCIAHAGGGTHQPPRRRRGGVQHGGARHHRGAEADRARSGSGSIARRTSSASRPTARCSTATWRPRRTGSSTWSMLRALQDETGGFLTYIPLAYHPDHNELGEELGRVGTATTGYEDLKNIAVGAAVPRQHPAREDPLADGDAVPVADRAQLRLRRRRGHGGLRADLSRGRRAHRDAHAVSRAGAS